MFYTRNPQAASELSAQATKAFNNPQPKGDHKRRFASLAKITSNQMHLLAPIASPAAPRTLSREQTAPSLRRPVSIRAHHKPYSVCRTRACSL